MWVCSAPCGPRGPIDAPHEIEGLALGTRVAQHLRAFVQQRRQGDTLSFWCTRAGLEVDFAVCCPDLFSAIEVKRSACIDKRDLVGLKAFGVDYAHAQHWLLSRSPESLLIDGIRCEPLKPCLRELRP
jgi:hypothetical protein